MEWYQYLIIAGMFIAWTRYCFHLDKKNNKLSQEDAALLLVNVTCPAPFDLWFLIQIHKMGDTHGRTFHSHEDAVKRRDLDVDSVKCSTIVKIDEGSDLGELPQLIKDFKEAQR